MPQSLAWRSADRVVPLHCSHEERQSTMQTRFRTRRHVAGGKGFPSLLCSIPRVLPTTPRRLRLYSAIAPVLRRYLFRVSLPRVRLAAVVGIPEQGYMQTECSRSFDGMLVAAISRVFVPRSCFCSPGLRQAE